MRALLPILAWLTACAPGGAPPEIAVRLEPSAPHTDAELRLVVTPASADGFELATAWTVDGAGVAINDGVVPPDLTLRGQRWRVAAAWTVSGVPYSAASAEVVIQNTDPQVALTLSPPTPGAGEAIAASITTIDPDNDALVERWRWERDGGVTPHIDRILPPGVTRRGERWTATVEVDDGVSTSAPASASVLIGNGRPVIGDLVVTPSPLTAITLPSASATVTDPDGDPTTLTWSWTLNGAPAGTEPTLEAALARGDRVEVTAAATDGQTQAVPRSSGPILVGNAPPRLTSPVQIAPAPPRVRDPITCAATAEDPDGDTITPTIAWSVDGAPWSIGPAPDPGFRKHQRLGCALTPFDGIDAGLSGEDEVEIANSPPRLQDARITPAAPSTDEFLGVVPGLATDDDGDGVTLHWVWVRGDEALAEDGALDPALTARGDQIQAVITPWDDEGPGEPFVTEPVLVGDTPPVATGVRLEPSAPRGRDPLTAVPEGVDLDGDPITWTARWIRDGVEIEGWRELVLPAGLLRRGEVIEVEVTPDDGLVAGAPLRSAPASVANSPPELAGAALVPDALFERTEASCEPRGAVDADGDLIRLDLSWTVDEQPAAPAPVAGRLGGDAFDKGQRVRCAIQASDTTDTGDLALSPTVVVSNTAPALGPAVLTPEVPQRGAPLGVTVDPPTDDDPADQGALALDYAWRVDGVEVSTEPTLSGDTITRGATVELDLTVSDPDGARASAHLGPVSVANAPPRIAWVRVLPNVAFADTDLLAEASVDDPDGDAWTVAWRWTLNGHPAGDDDPALPATAFDRGDVVRLTVTATDGIDTSAPFEAPSLIVANAPPGPPTLAVSPAPALAGVDPLLCEIVAEPRDIDGDAFTWTFAWTVDGEPYPRPGDVGPGSRRWPGDTALAADTHAGERWTCTATPFDPFDAGAPGSASAEVIDYALRGLSAGYGFGCGLRPDGSIRCWGADEVGQASPPTTGTWRTLASSFNHTCALDDRGLLRCWGGNPLLSLAPFGVYSALSVQTAHGCAVRADGAAVCWGDPTHGVPSPPAGVFVDVAAGQTWACALGADGGVACWGERVAATTDVPAEPGFTALAATSAWACAIDAGGALRCWGDLAGVDLPAGRFRRVTGGLVFACTIDIDGAATCFGPGAPTAPGGVRFIEVAVGAEHACGLDDVGQVHCWGSDRAGESTPPTTPWEAIVAGGAGACATTPGAPLRCWGDPATTAASPPAGLLSGGPLALGARIACAQPAEPTGPVCWGAAAADTGPAAPVDVLRAGDAHACAIAGGALSCWGDDALGQASPPVEPGWVDVAAGGAHTCGVTLDGRARCWGANSFGQATAPAGQFVAIAAGQFTTCAIDAPTSGLTCWGDDAGVGLLSPPPGAYVTVAVGDAHACAIQADGAIHCWGDNAAGQLTAPAGQFTALTAGDDHTCAIRPEGGATCWGALAH